MLHFVRNDVEISFATNHSTLITVACHYSRHYAHSRGNRGVSKNHFRCREKFVLCVKKKHRLRDSAFIKRKRAKCHEKNFNDREKYFKRGFRFRVFHSANAIVNFFQNNFCVKRQMKNHHKKRPRARKFVKCKSRPSHPKRRKRKNHGAHKKRACKKQNYKDKKKQIRCKQKGSAKIVFATKSRFPIRRVQSVVRRKQNKNRDSRYGVKKQSAYDAVIHQVDKKRKHQNVNGALGENFCFHDSNIYEKRNISNTLFIWGDILFRYRC